MIANVAAVQHGLVTTTQLATAGIYADGLARRLRSGRLHRIHRGVYAVGHSGLTLEGRWLAAVLACGRGAALSHRAAAALWKLLPPAPPPIDIIVSGSGGRVRRPGIRRHRSRTLRAADLTVRHHIPVTTPARTIADLRRVIPPERLRRAIREAEARGFDLGPAADPHFTRSELEHMFLRLCRRHRVPMPEANVRIGPFVVDFLWRDRSLIAETDGYQYHRGRQAFDEDRARDTDLRLLGFDVVRFTYTHVTAEPAWVARTIRELLERR